MVARIEHVADSPFKVYCRSFTADIFLNSELLLYLRTVAHVGGREPYNLRDHLEYVSCGLDLYRSRF